MLFLAHVEFKEMGEHETKGEFYEKRITTKEFKEGRTVKTCHIYGFDDFRIHHTKFGFGLFTTELTTTATQTKIHTLKSVLVSRT